MPLYAGIERLRAQGDQFQWGGPQLFADARFGTPDGRARFSAVTSPDRSRPAGTFLLSTRRGKQFNSMVQRERDPLTGAAREDVLMAAEDAARLGLADGARLRLRSSAGTFEGRLKVDGVKPGSQVKLAKAETQAIRRRGSAHRVRNLARDLFGTDAERKNAVVSALRVHQIGGGGMVHQIAVALQITVISVRRTENLCVSLCD